MGTKNVYYNGTLEQWISAGFGDIAGIYNEDGCYNLYIGNTLLNSLNIPETVNKINTYAFANTSISNVTIPSTVKSISSFAFYGCSKLSSITIPKSVTRIGSSSFAVCSALKDINFNGTKEQWNTIEKGIYWDYNTGDYTVICTNGKLDKNDNEIN